MYVHARHGSVTTREDEHNEWLVVAQDCDLAWNAIVGSDSLIELRPVFYDNPPQEWGIRSARFKVDGSGAHIKSEAAAVRVTPDVLLHAAHLTCLHPASTRRLKTWLGLRYDRPAVPEVYVDLARDIAERIRKKKNRSGAEPIRDVLAVFNMATDGTIEYQVVAVVPSVAANSDPDLVDNARQWLAAVVLPVPTHLGMPTRIDAYRDDEVSLAFLEHAYALDVSSVSWPANELGPTGAVG